MPDVKHLPNLTNGPPHEWRYRVPETGQFFQNASLSGLMETLRSHYRSNGYAIPDSLLNLIEAYICGEEPEYCSGNASSLPKTERVTGGGLAHTFHVVLQGTKTLISWVAGGGERVSQAIADGRAATCATCPENVNPEGCSGCNIAELLRIGEKVAGTRKTSSDASLNACRVCSCLLKAKVWIPHKNLWPHMNEEQKLRLPTACWLVREASIS